MNGRVNEQITGIGVWKDPTRDHRLRLRGAKERPPAEEGVDLEAAEGRHLQTSRLHGLHRRVA